MIESERRASHLQPGWIVSAARMFRRSAAACVALTGLGLGAGATGCGAAGFGSELSTVPVAKPVSDISGGTIRIPQDEKFSIRQQSDHDQAELGGSATADATAAVEGTAAATADVTHGGTAEGTFQLGHAFQNDSNRQMDLLVRVRCTYEATVSNEPVTALPDAFAGLNLYARDGRNRLVRTDVLAAQSTEQGGTTGGGQVERRFTLTLAPGDSVAVFVAGNARVGVKPERSARSSIRLTGLELEVSPKLAPAVGSGS